MLRILFTLAAASIVTSVLMLSVTFEQEDGIVLLMAVLCTAGIFAGFMMWWRGTLRAQEFGVAIAAFSACLHPLFLGIAFALFGGLAARLVLAFVAGMFLACVAERRESWWSGHFARLMLSAWWGLFGATLLPIYLYAPFESMSLMPVIVAEAAVLMLAFVALPWQVEGTLPRAHKGVPWK